MSRGLVAERAKLSLFVLRRGVRAVSGRLKVVPLSLWRFSAAGADRLLIAPQDLRTADPTRASEIYGGRFAFAGKVVLSEGRSPFQIASPSEEWSEVLAGFGWLRHLRAAESNLTRSSARSLITDWLQHPHDEMVVGWRPEVVARRVLSWLMHAPFVLNEAEVRFYRRFMRSLTRQVRFLQRNTYGVADGLPRLQVLMALVYASLCMANQHRLFKPAVRRLGDELQRQILADGGHISRNPAVLLELLLDLLPLRQAFGARNIPPPPAILNAIDRMMPMLRFFRHGDGAFAQFNGMGPTSPDLLATVLAYDDARGKPVANASHSGYQRIESSGAVLLMDAGVPPPLAMSQEAHAGCLSFEFSAQRHRVVVNCGLPSTNRRSWRHFARTTPAHSTVAIGGESSCQFLTSGRLQRLVGAPITAGPTAVPVVREHTDGEVKIRASHDGYAGRFGLIHERAITLSSDGRRLDGEDIVSPRSGTQISRRANDEFAVHFHLYPGIQANRLTHRNGVMLVLPNRDIWTFEAYDHPVEIEDSVYLGGRDGPRRTSQIVIRAKARRTPRVAWSFVAMDPLESAAAQVTAEPELPL
jgi:uncharacterized heparinase superfamily protein